MRYHTTSLRFISGKYTLIANRASLLSSHCRFSRCTVELQTAAAGDSLPITHGWNIPDSCFTAATKYFALCYSVLSSYPSMTILLILVTTFGHRSEASLVNSQQVLSSSRAPSCKTTSMDARSVICGLCPRFSLWRRMRPPPLSLPLAVKIVACECSNVSVQYKHPFLLLHPRICSLF